MMLFIAFLALICKQSSCDLLSGVKMAVLGLGLGFNRSCEKDRRMDDLRFYVLFFSISVI